MKSWRPWTEAENVHLRDNYMRTPNAVLGRLFNRTPKAVSNQVARLGLPVRPSQVAPVLPPGWKEREWTAEEDALLRKLALSGTDEEIGRKIGRSRLAVKARRAHLGIRKNRSAHDHEGAARIHPKRNSEFIAALRSEAARRQEDSHAHQG